MDIQSLILNSIYKALVDNWKIWATVILFFVACSVASVFISRAMRKAEKKLKYLYLSKTDPRRFKIESSIDKNICPECGAELIIKYDRYGKFKGCINYPRCRFATKL